MTGVSTLPHSRLTTPAWRGLVLDGGRRNKFMSVKHQLYYLWPILLAVNIWEGFSDGWKTMDFIQLGLILFVGFILLLMVCKAPAKK